ncbi:MAG: cytochrome ubiquinol oxidase subunit I [Candidatus Adiutrix sp.]|jgi:cytochrome d ubiquinol oxidase subunit I|nr:cytochrome ubiquinol oxidase subunit I [Candidatus Adiutrix sp.]
MDPVILSRLQFALATFFHFLYVPLTLGLAPYIAVMETRYVKTGQEIYKAQAKFWGRIFLINFALGVVTGITLEFQFGTNWAEYSKGVGDIFGSLLAIEATMAFFLESTFIAVWAFGWDKVSPKTHLTAIWLVAGAGLISALWILLANGFMQNPVGYQVEGPLTANGELAAGSRLVLDSFTAVLTNPYGWAMYAHTVLGALTLCGFLVMGVSAWHLFLRKNVEFFHTSFKLGLCFALTFSILSALAGHQLGQITAKYQPAKLAAMESQWETRQPAPMHILVIPPLDDSEENLVEALPLPGVLSFMATNHFDSEVKGLKAFKPEDRPPVWPVYLSFRLMVGLGTLFILAALLATAFRHRIPELKYSLLLFVLMIPLPYLALELGWTVTEVGRQPWVVYDLLRTSLAGSPVDWYQIAASLAVMAGVYTLLTILGFYLMGKAALRDPAPWAAK